MPTLEETLQNFLFNKIKEDDRYPSFRENDVPAHIADNLAKSKTLRPYQEEAVKRFLYCFGESGGIPQKNHLLFNMATGSGKTLIMAAAILHLYAKGYRNFIFLVHSKNILTQAINSFTNASYEKYLFNQKISFNGRAIETRKVTDFENANDIDINMIFMTTQLFFNRMNNAAEDVLQKSDFADNQTVVIADEAHHLNVETAKNIKERDNWERSVTEVLNMRDDNVLLEFTATVDLMNPYINKKYKDKLLYKYDFAEFNNDGYSKQVQFLFNKEAKIADQKRLLIVNAVALSQFRKMQFEDLGYPHINPIMLVKSKRIADSEQDKEFFHEVINTLKVSDFKFLKNVQKDEKQVVSSLFKYLERKKISEGAFIQSIRSAFTEKSTIIYNSKNQKNAELLKDLDEQNPRNIIRVVFSVNALNEGWDVLSLYDIVHFDIGKDKKVKQQDIQLIGRGARYCPFLLKEEKNSHNLFGVYGTEPDKRKFDDIGIKIDERKILDNFYYHFVETQTFLDGLIKNLKNEGILNEEVQKVSIKMKDSFMQSNTYKKGFVLVNSIEKRQKTTKDEKERVFGETLDVTAYELSARALTDAEEAKNASGRKVGDMNIIKDFDRNIIKKSLMAAENGFFRFANLKEHITYLQSIDQFIDEGLGTYTIRYEHQVGKDIHNLEVREKLQLLIGEILPKVRKIVDRELPKKSAGREFRPVSLRKIFEKEKSVYIRSHPETNERTGKVEYVSPGERAEAQSDSNNPKLQLDIAKLEWYAYNENYGTSEEKRFVKYIDSQIEQLFEKFTGAEIFLLRNELDYWIYGEGGKRFSPDYLLFINDAKGKKFYYQCIFEPKGSHLLEKDRWKEKTLEELEKMTKVSFDIKDGDKKAYAKYLGEVKKMGYTIIKNMGFAFYNSENAEQSLKFKGQFQKIYD
ncbi:MAG: DEAD/DEAH box helicase family protein [Candidatus Kaiserbacteria bacterium]|nr:DEAD/DEAH box helicase family protein [Candidatus Kaiserbacteria bacterium]